MHQVEGSCHDLVGSCAERQSKKNEEKIRTWSKMEKKLRDFFFPLDYAQTLFHRFQNLNQNLSTVEEITNEFYQLSIHVDHQETNEELAARYVNFFKFYIQDELSMHRVHNVEEAYQLALKVEEKKLTIFSKDQRRKEGYIVYLMGWF